MTSMISSKNNEDHDVKATKQKLEGNRNIKQEKLDDDDDRPEKFSVKDNTYTNVVAKEAPQSEVKYNLTDIEQRY